jgi:hypothetical protein
MIDSSLNTLATYTATGYSNTGHLNPEPIGSKSKSSHLEAANYIFFKPLASTKNFLNASDELLEPDTSAPEDDCIMLAALKQRIIRSAGAELGDKFVAMVPDVVEEEDTEAISLDLNNRQIEGLRYQGEVYRLLESFAPHHRLQAFCLGQLLQEQMTSYVLTGSAERFAVWVNVRAIPQR